VFHGITKPAKPFKAGACQRVGIIAQNHKSFINHLQAVRLGAGPATAATAAAATIRATHNTSLISGISMKSELVSEGAVGTTSKRTEATTGSSSTGK
jgi:hypothetical protein